MPEILERSLKKKAKKLFGSTKSERASAYIYGTMAKIKKAKGGHW